MAKVREDNLDLQEIPLVNAQKTVIDSIQVETKND